MGKELETRRWARMWYLCFPFSIASIPIYRHKSSLYSAQSLQSETRSLRTWHEAEMAAVSVPLCPEQCLKNVKARVDAWLRWPEVQTADDWMHMRPSMWLRLFLLWPLRTSLPRGRVWRQEFQRPSKSCRTCPDLFSEVSTKLSRFKRMLLTSLTYLSPDLRGEFSLKLCGHRAREHCGKRAVLCCQLWKRSLPRR